MENTLRSFEPHLEPLGIADVIEAQRNQESDTLVPIEIFRFIEEREFDSRSALQCPLVRSVFPDGLDHTTLFTYCFRRFGLPNHGSDPYKDLAAYLLKTKRPDVFMLVTPNPSGVDRLSLSFVVDQDIYAAVMEYRKDGDMRPFKRNPDWTTWGDEDPLRVIVETARAALEDLKYPTNIRDHYFNALGDADPQMDEEYQDINEAGGELYSETAGNGFGQIISAAPEEVFAIADAAEELVLKGKAKDFKSAMKAIAEQAHKTGS